MTHASQHQEMAAMKNEGLLSYLVRVIYTYMYIYIYIYRKHKLSMTMFWSLLGGAHIQSGQRRENEELQHWEHRTPHFAIHGLPWLVHSFEAAYHDKSQPIYRHLEVFSVYIYIYYIYIF